MRNNGAFYRTDEISREPSQCPDWIDLLATKMEIDERVKIASSKTAVEVARNRQNSQPSIYEMMSAIVGGQKPKYSSVEEAVKDYQRRTGLEAYLKRTASHDLNDLASIIAKAGDDVGDAGACDECGCSYSECECNDEDEDDDEDEDKDDAADCFRRNLDYGDARDMTEEELEANPGKKKLISEASDKPELLVQYPDIELFLVNTIETNPGIQVPAILHSLIETFSREGIDFRIFSDKDLLSWINEQLINKGSTRNEIPSQLGRGVGIHVEYSGDKDSNKDPFTLLVPDKGSF